MPETSNEASSVESDSIPESPSIIDSIPGIAEIVIPEMPKDLVRHSVDVSSQVAKIEAEAVLIMFVRNQLDGRPMMNTDIINPCQRRENINLFFPVWSDDDDLRAKDSRGEVIDKNEPVVATPEMQRLDAIALIDMAKARSKCMGCQFRIQCLTTAVLMPLDKYEESFEGIWGGWAAGGRQSIKKLFTELRRLYQNGRRALDTGESIPAHRSMPPEMIKKIEERARQIKRPAV